MPNNDSPLKDSLRVLLADTVDYAGLFPPSQLPMANSVRNYAGYLKNEFAWMLGRFVVPVANLDRFSTEFEKVYEEGETGWRLSAIIGEDAAKDIKKISRFNAKNKARVLIETIEAKADSAEKIKEIAAVVPEDLTIYFEIPSSVILTDLVTAISLTKTRAKIRTGGTTANAFPPVDEIVKFMRVCTAANIPFKATAGLHHPLRCIKPLTYEENAPKGLMNGFLNLFLAAIFLRQNLNHTFVHELMNETDATNFTFTDESISWKNHTVTMREIEIARQKCVISFGSCSFTEPFEDLQDLELL